MKDPSTKSANLENDMKLDSGLGTNAGRNTVNASIGGAGACTTSVVGRGLPVTTRT